jgi:acyl-CoA reductase-like NAD-dependent aldehyde dehydrogenase
VINPADERVLASVPSATADEVHRALLAATYRESSIGGEDGKWGLLRYTQVKTAYHHYG